MKVIGILGGMGPQATIDLYQKIINLTPAKVDQDHIPVLIWSNPVIPDRTAALLHGGADPTPALVHGAKLLEAGGAACIAIPCNTAHLFVEAIAGATSIPIVNMIQKTVSTIAAQCAARSRVGVLATTGTLQCKLYQQALEKVGLESMIPELEFQQTLMNAIYGIKAGFVDEGNRQKVLAVLENLRRGGAEAIIAGCTELPLVLNGLGIPGLFDPTEILARAAISFAVS